MRETIFVWDSVNDCVISELDGSGAVQVSYTNEPQQYGGVISQRRGTTTSTYHADALGSTRALTDNSGNLTDTYLNDAWGNSVASTGTTVNPFRWVGKYGYYTDNSTGQVYVRARMYQPTVARWSSMDPIRIVAELNWFTYTTSSPTYRVDLSGLFSISTDNLESLGCNHLNEHELRDLETCGPTNGKCGCTVWNVGPTTNLTQQTIQDPFLDPRNIAQPVCNGGKLIVQINPNRNQKLEEPPFNIPNPLGLLELYNNLGVGKCLYAHEMHHIAQYNCVCPDLCAKQDGPITISASCLGIAECWAYAGQSNCMIKAACAAFHRGKLDGPRPDPSQLQLFETIMKLIDFWGQHAQGTYCRQYANIAELTKNGQNWKELVARRPCRPSFGI